MDKNEERNTSYQRAKKKTEALRKFYKHLTIYIVVNIAISVYKVSHYLEEGSSFEDAIFNIDTLAVWVVWGAFVVLQAIRTFNPSMFMGADWEEKKIRQYMDENKR